MGIRFLFIEQTKSYESLDSAKKAANAVVSTFYGRYTSYVKRAWIEEGVFLRSGNHLRICFEVDAEGDKYKELEGFLTFLVSR